MPRSRKAERGGGAQTVPVAMSGALGAAAQAAVITRDNPQTLDLQPGTYTVDIKLTATQASANAGDCEFNWPAAGATGEMNTYRDALIDRLISLQDGLPIEIGFNKEAVDTDKPAGYVALGGDGMGIAGLVHLHIGALNVTSSGNLNDPTATRTFTANPTFGEVRVLTRVGSKPKDPITDLRCTPGRIRRDSQSLTGLSWSR